MNPNSKQKRIAFGYQRLVNNRIAIREGQAATLQLIYRMYTEGKSLVEIKAIMELMNIWKSASSYQFARKHVIMDVTSTPQNSIT